MALADDGRCGTVPDDQRALCLMVQACATLADEAERQRCYGAAAERLDAGGAIGPTEPSIPEPAAEDAAPAVQAPLPPVAAQTEREPESAETAPTEITPAVVRSEPRPAAPASAGVPESTEADERVGTLKRVRRLFARAGEEDGESIPRRFTAAVTDHRDLARDRQLVVLDAKLLFEGDNAASSRIDVGDKVNVVKVSSRRGRRYQITGPSRRYFTALRIRCERTDLKADNRRKCDSLMGNPGQ